MVLNITRLTKIHAVRLVIITSNNINVKYIAENNRFSIYDFIIEKDGIKYIVELKSRLQKLENHTIELI